MGARGILLGQVACCALMAAAILACAIGSMVLAETKVRITIIKVRPVTVAPEPPAVFGVSPDWPKALDEEGRKVRPVTVQPALRAEFRVLPDWPNALAEEDRIRCAAASDMCAWKRIPGGR